MNDDIGVGTQPLLLERTDAMTSVDNGATVERVKRSIRERNVNDTYRDQGVVYAVQLSNVSPDRAMCSVNWSAGRSTRVRAKYLRVLE